MFVNLRVVDGSFLSTLSLRRATDYGQYYIRARGHFYPRSPCGERPNQCKIDKQCSSISIHALLAESDHPAFFYIAQHTYFYPRSPCGERLYLVRGQRPSWQISIHALLAESDAPLL